MDKKDHKQQDAPKVWQEFLLILTELQNGCGINFRPLADYAGEETASRGAAAIEAHQKQLTFDFVGFWSMIQPI